MSEKIILTDEQLASIDMMINNNIGILTGGPGVGKSTATKEILNWADSQNLSTALCAPTGKAAKRMMEITGRQSSTIHKLLGPTMEDDEFIFSYNEENPLSYDFIVIDEFSMVTNNLAADLLRAIDYEKTKVLIVGDPGQLPSVGAGAVLRDLLACDWIPNVKLTKIHRNSGEIVKACHKISKGESYDACTKLDVENGYNLRHIQTSAPESIQDVIQKLFPKMIDRGFDPVWDVQVLSPTNSRSILSCDGLNEILQNQLNPLPEGKQQEKGVKFRLNDKVIQIKNTKIDDIYNYPTYIVNGDVGQIIRMEEKSKKMTVKFFDPERIVSISKKNNNLLLAYCITCHRAQGSEAPVIIIPVHKTFTFTMNRNWIYTAISRAKVMCFTVGQFSAITNAIPKEDTSHRVTRLKENLDSNFDSHYDDI